MNPTYFSYRNVSLGVAIIGFIALGFADLGITNADPWLELNRLWQGILHPQLETTEIMIDALAHTLAFAFVGVALGAVVGFLLALIFNNKIVRLSCAFIRSIHELFWALIFLQIFGLHPLTGLLALALPYAATFAKIYAEILQHSHSPALITLPANTGLVSRFIYGKIPDALADIKTYTMYRLECGLRASAVLGFIGLPTLGYYMETAFMEGLYSQLVGFLLLFYVLIFTMRYWLHAKLVPLYLIAALWFLAQNFTPIEWQNIARFFTEDIVPYPIRTGAPLNEVWHWFSQLFTGQMLPGFIHTIVLTQVALLLTGVLTLMLFPIISKHFFNKPSRKLGQAVLVIMRSTPEYILAFMLLQMWGPSMLPAIIALALHNAGILGHLVGKHSNTLTLRPDHPTGLNLYTYEILPRSYGQFLAYYFYRWEIIMRETAILGLLGIATLGFYVDSAMQELRFDRAMVLIIFTAFLNMGIDAISRYVRHHFVGEVQTKKIN